MITTLRQWIWTRRQSLMWAIFETLLWVVVVMGISYAVTPMDPLTLKAAFPWVLFAPIFVALFYGFWFGLVTLALVIGIGLFIAPQAIFADEHFRYFLLGSALVTFACGEFSSYWRSQLTRRGVINDYLQQRLESLSRAYYTVRLSHDRLEQSLISRPVTLRSALGEIRQQVLAVGGDLNEKTAARLLTLLSQYYSLNEAAICLVQRGQLNPTPIAQLGELGDVNTKDPLLVQVLAEQDTLYRAVDTLDAPQPGQYLAVIPFRTTTQQCLGVLMIRDISFWMLNKETLQSLSVLLAYFADDVYACQMARAFTQRYPDCPPQFAAELYKLIEIKRRIQVDSSLAVLIIKDTAHRDAIITQFDKLTRGVDFFWHQSHPGQDLLITLMPLSGASAINGYVSRLQVWLRQEFGVTDWNDHIYIRYTPLNGQSPEAVVDSLITGSAV